MLDPDPLMPDDEGYVVWNHQEFLDSMSPSARRNHQRWEKTLHIRLWMSRHFPWMRWSVLNVVYIFWELVLEEGNPRNGLIFSFLNDGYKPSLWHTYQSVVHPHGKYSGIYISGAPKNKHEA